MAMFAGQQNGYKNRKMSRYMQPTKSYNNRLNAKISGSEIADHRRDDYNSYDDNSGGRATVFNLNNKKPYSSRSPKYLSDNNVYGIITTSSSPLAKKARQSLLLSNGNAYSDPKEEETQLRKLLDMYSKAKSQIGVEIDRYKKKEAECNNLVERNMELTEQVYALQKQIEEAEILKKTAALVPQLVIQNEEADEERKQLEAAVDLYRNLEINHERTFADAISMVLPTLQKLGYVCPALNAEIIGMQRGLNASASPITAIASIFKRTSILLVDEINQARGRLNRHSNRNYNKQNVNNNFNENDDVYIRSEKFKMVKPSISVSSASSISSQQQGIGANLTFHTPISNKNNMNKGYQTKNISSTSSTFITNNSTRTYSSGRSISSSSGGNSNRVGMEISPNYPYNSTRTNSNKSDSPRKRMMQNIKSNLTEAPTQKIRVGKVRRDSFV